MSTKKSLTSKIFFGLISLLGCEGTEDPNQESSAEQLHTELEECSTRVQSGLSSLQETEETLDTILQRMLEDEGRVGNNEQHH